jgi:signal transduction histidine kinase
VEQQPQPIRRQDGRPLLLIAEDNADLRRLLVRNLRDEYEILETANGLEALRLARKELPRIVLSDLMMPELDGFQLCKALKEAPETMGIPFILLTARADMEGKLTGLRAGADDYVIKPFHLEEVRARLRAQLRMASLAEAVSQRERLASLGVLVAGVAHEIRNPLNGIINSLQPLKEMLSDSSDAAGKLLDLALASAHRVDEISLQLLQQARPVDGYRSEVDLALNVSLAVRLLSHKTEAGPRLIAEIPTRAHISVMGEPGALNQVWVNLINNAIDAAGPTGEVTVRVGSAGDSAHVEVLDTGPGISPQIMKKIFDPFFTTKPAGMGTGLGLSLVRDTIKKHGGEITVHSSPGEGSRFRITLPAAEAVRGEAHASG